MEWDDCEPDLEFDVVQDQACIFHILNCNPEHVLNLIRRPVSLFIAFSNNIISVLTLSASILPLHL